MGKLPTPPLRKILECMNAIRERSYSSFCFKGKLPECLTDLVYCMPVCHSFLQRLVDYFFLLEIEITIITITILATSN